MGAAVGVLLDSLLLFTEVLLSDFWSGSPLSRETFPPAFPAEKLGARLGGCVEGRLQLSLSEAEGDSLVDGVIEPVVEDDAFFIGGELPFKESFSR